jgi:hypothetical protein
MPKPITILRKKAKAGAQGLPKATLAFYGPDNKRASKAVLGIFLRDDDDVILHKYFDDEKDVRFSIKIQEDILARIREHEVRTLIMREGIFGCPHEEGIDYPDGEECHKCPFWKGRDRYAE